MCECSQQLDLVVFPGSFWDGTGQASIMMKSVSQLSSCPSGPCALAEAATFFLSMVVSWCEVRAEASTVLIMSSQVFSWLFGSKHLTQLAVFLFPCFFTLPFATLDLVRHQDSEPEKAQ
jgi:hypothetical protein